MLNDTDVLLKNMDLSFTRYVDDSQIVVPAGAEAHAILCRLAEHPIITEGLSLNVTKTKLSSVRDRQKSSKARLQDVFSSAEMESMHALITLSYADYDDASADDALTDPFIEAAFLLDKPDGVEDNKSVDLSVYMAILRALRFLPDLDATRLLSDQADLLYYVPREFCLAFKPLLSK